jgi:hypothetical protein
MGRVADCLVSRNGVEVPMTNLTFYDGTGCPVAYSNDEENVYMFSGEPVAYLKGNSVYAFDGSHLGFFTDGWVRDHQGFYVFFTENAKGGPPKPLRALKPLKSIRKIRPVRGVRALRPLRPLRQLAWSPLSGAQFFE